MLQSGAIITRPNIKIYFIQHCSSNLGRTQTKVCTHKKTPHISPSRGTIGYLLWGFWKQNGLRYNGIVMYQSIYIRLTRTTGCAYTVRCSLVFWLLSFMWCSGLCDTYLGQPCTPCTRFCMHYRWRQICTVFVIDMLTFITQINKWKYIIIWINAGWSSTPPYFA